ncbi:MAG: Si-specific NAD(P)(+) transhydrogenase [Candidatus Binatia bacterium]
MRHFDLCVIGSGPGGQKAAIQASKLGREVCVIEEREAVGGVAVHTGTIPSKTLREVILMIGGAGSATPRVKDFRIAGRDATLKELRTHYQAVIRTEMDIVRAQLDRNGIAIIGGRGRFADAHTIEVAAEHASEAVTADYVVIAVGTTPARPAEIPFDGHNVITTDELFHLGAVPHSMIIVGGGVIGTEYASMLSALGVRVTLIDGRHRLLEFVDGEIIEALQYHLRQGGMTLRLGETVAEVKRVPAPKAARTSNGAMAEVTLESGKTLVADCLMYCVGRQGATDALNLDAIGLTTDARGRIAVDADYRTAVPHVFAVGDVIGFPALASTSMEQGRVASCRMFGERCEAMAQLLPYGIYAIPEISMVGKTEEQLTREGVPYETGVAQYREIARGQLLGDEIGMLKLLIHPHTRVVLGVHAIGTGATELIHIGQAVIAFQGTADYFVDAVFNYPTLAECYRVAALNGLNKLVSD